MILLSLIDLGVLIIPVALWVFGVLSSIEVLFIIMGSIIVLATLAYRKIEFPQISDDDKNRICVVLALEESSSQFANRFIRKACELSELYCNYRYIAIGTPALTEGTEIELTYDVSKDMVWGIPNIQQILTMCFVSHKFIRFILKNEHKVQTIISYSSPDLTSKLFNLIKNRTTADINFIATGVPEKEVLSKKVGKQTQDIFRNSKRVILPYSGGQFDDYYQKLSNLGLWDKDKVLHCQSSLIMEYIYKAKNIKVNLDENKDIVLMLGSRYAELSHHYKIASAIIHKFTNSQYRLVFLCPNNEFTKKLKFTFSKYNNVVVLNQKDYKFERAKLAIIKSGTGLIKPVLYGIPTIPFYIPSLRTKIYATWYTKKEEKSNQEKFNKSMLILPNLITNSNFLDSSFMGSVNIDNLVGKVDKFILEPPAAEEFRMTFAREFLNIRTEADSFKSLVRQYLLTSKANLESIKKRLISDARCNTDTQIVLSFKKKHDAWFERFELYEAYLNCGLNSQEFHQDLDASNLKLNDAEGLFIASGIQSDKHKCA